MILLRSERFDAIADMLGDTSFTIMPYFFFGAASALSTPIILYNLGVS